MLVLLIWVAAAVVALVVLGVVGYDVLTRLRRLGRAASAADRDISTQVAAFRLASLSSRRRAR